MIGRNNSLFHIFENGFVAWTAFAAYIMTTLAVIQIWNYTTYYINIYGRHGIREHVFMFVNMFLLYFMGEGTRNDWQEFHTQYHIAWAMILMNIGIQYLIELRNHKLIKENRDQIIKTAGILFAEMLIVLACIPVYQYTGNALLSLAAILFGIGAVLFIGRKNRKGFVDFTHLSERAMLYVVFTFGEMIIAIASYFEGEFSLRSTYFALMAFLIAAGLFLSYGVFYDSIIDREKKTNGLFFMLLHIFIIFAMNNITNGLEFMREEEISLVPKILFLMFSFLMYFGFVFALGSRYAKSKCSHYRRLCITALILSVVFTALIFLFRNLMVINIALTVIYVFALFVILYRYGKTIGKNQGDNSPLS